MKSSPEVAVLFDLDGTLLSLDVDIEEVRQRLAARFTPLGVARPFRPILRRIREAAREAAHGGDPTALERDGFAILDAEEVRAARSARARDGAAEVLAALRARGIRLGLVTDNGRACLGPALMAAGLPGDFDAVATRDDVPAPKPDPAGILQVAATLGAKAMWFVGDHPRDVEAARAAKLPALRVALVPGGLAARQDVERANADVLLKDLRGVLTLPGIG